jgi:hypothetical protein
MADHLGWLAELIDALDGKHEQRSHGTYQPRAWDELCSARVDGWGLSHPSPEVIGGPDRLKLPRVLIGYQWSRAIGRAGGGGTRRSTPAPPGACVRQPDSRFRKSCRCYCGSASSRGLRAPCTGSTGQST